jgi:DNA-binding transcriptional MerR regulator
MDAIDISEVARRTGLTPRALRFYEARGLVRPLRTGAGRRLYGPGELARLHAVVALKRAGFPLSAIGGMLAGRNLDLGRIVAAQLEELDARAAELAEARALLLTVQSRIDRGEPIDVATFCSLIRTGEGQMEEQRWKEVTDRYFTPEEQADFAKQMARMPPEFSQVDYNAKWKDLGARIKAALPLDPASAEARAFADEWAALLAPFNAVATPAMKAGVARMYENMGSWHGQADPGFDVEVFQFIKAAVAAHRMGCG